MKIYNLSSNSSLATNSSGGQLLKWKIGDTYIKTSTLDKQSLQTKFMHESYAEVIASRIGQKLGLDIVKYKLCEVVIDNRIKTIACESKEFKPLGYKEYSIGKLMQLRKIPILSYNDMDSYYSLIKSIEILTGINIKNYIDTLILFDSLILNDDRHFGNFGIMINNDENIKTLPIFDNGNSLFCHKYTDELSYEDGLINFLRFKPFNINCNQQLMLINKNIISSSRLLELKAYIPRLLTEMIQKDLPKSKAKFIKDLLFSRIDYLINN